MPDLIDSYGRVKIIQQPNDILPMYAVSPSKLTAAEQKIVDDPRRLVGDYVDVVNELERLRTYEEREKYLYDYLIKKLDGKVSKENLDEVVYLVMDDVFLGYGKLGPMMHDPNLEEVMVNNVDSPVYVVHRRHGMCATNIAFNSKGEIHGIINWLSRYVGRKIDEEHPLLDAHMPDGSRANVAIPPAAPYGPSLTIRKFKRTPYNLVNLIELESVSVDLAAFLWMCVEGMGLAPVNMLIAGGAGSGKTTLLNALAMCVPPKERVVTVEDTLELNFNFIDNWVPLEATPEVFNTGLNMHALLKNSLRMRPDRVIVGEVRGSEAETLLVAMDIGLSGSMGTIHANNARESTIRLMNEPMNVPVRMIPLIDLVIVMNRIYDRSKGMVRRVTQVAEIGGLERETVQMGDIYLWDVNRDEINRTEYPILLMEKIARKTGSTKKKLNTELLVRQKILKYMINNNINENHKVIKILQEYNTDPALVIEELKNNSF